jgi:uncharacterized membrane protein
MGKPRKTLDSVVLALVLVHGMVSIDSIVFLKHHSALKVSIFTIEFWVAFLLLLLAP